MSVYGMSRPDFYQNVIACLIKFCHLIGNAMPHILRTHDISAPIPCLRERRSSPGVEYLWHYTITLLSGRIEERTRGNPHYLQNLCKTLTSHRLIHYLMIS